MNFVWYWSDTESVHRLEATLSQARGLGRGHRGVVHAFMCKKRLKRSTRLVLKWKRSGSLKSQHPADRMSGSGLSRVWVLALNFNQYKLTSPNFFSARSLPTDRHYSLKVWHTRRGENIYRQIEKLSMRHSIERHSVSFNESRKADLLNSLYRRLYLSCSISMVNHSISKPSESIDPRRL